MKLPLLLLFLLLGTVAALHVGNNAPYLDSQESQADLSQDLEGSGEQEGESFLTEEAIQSEGEQVEASSCQDAFEDKKAMESVPGALDENLQCPRAEDIVEMLGSNGFKYRLVKRRYTFANARFICQNCFNGALVSIHNSGSNNQIWNFSRRSKKGRVWLGGTIRNRSCVLHWTDGSTVNFNHWSRHLGHGHCVSLSTRGGFWHQECCERRLPFLCSS